MRISLTGLIFSLAFIVTSATSAQSLFTPLVNNILSGGQLCGEITHAHYDQFIQSRNLSQYARTPDMILTGYGFFSELVFKESQKHFQKKVQCLEDFAQKVQETPKAIEEVRRSMMIVWLNLKKSQLYLKECSLMDKDLAQMSIRSVGQTWSNSSGLKDPYYEYLKANSRFNLDYYQICRNLETRAALKGLVNLSERAMPFFSSKGLLKMMEEERALILNKATDRPVTDKELMDRSLMLTSSTPLFRFDREKSKNLYDKLNHYIQQRLNSNQELLREVSDTKFSPRKLKSLYDEGTVEEVLDQMGLHSLAPAEEVNEARMFACFKNEYEDSMLGQMLDFMGLFLGARSVLKNTDFAKALPGQVSEALKKYKMLKRTSQNTKFIQRYSEHAIDAAAALVSSSPILVNKCILRHKTRDRFSGKASGHNIRFSKSDLPKDEVDIDLYTLDEVKINDIPSCKDMGYNQIYLAKSSDLNCLQESILSISPMILGLGYSMSIMED